MNPQLQVWMPAVLSLFGTLIVVVLTMWLNTRAVLARGEATDAKIELLRAEMRGEISALRAEMNALRAEMKQGFAELRLEFHTALSELTHRVERLEERPGLVQRP